jgi:hypothetical protein
VNLTKAYNQCSLLFSVYEEAHDRSAFLEGFGFNGSRPVPGKHIIVHFNQGCNSMEWLVGGNIGDA